MQPPDSRELILPFDHAQAPLARVRVEQQNSNVHPLIAHQIRSVTKNAIRKSAFPGTYSCLCFIHDFTSNSGMAAGLRSWPQEAALALASAACITVLPVASAHPGHRRTIRVVFPALLRGAPVP